jgi:hypothetical protein
VGHDSAFGVGRAVISVKMSSQVLPTSVTVRAVQTRSDRFAAPTYCADMAMVDAVVPFLQVVSGPGGTCPRGVLKGSRHAAVAVAAIVGEIFPEGQT